MGIKRPSVLALTLLASLSLIVTAPADAANPDDGYPQGAAAPGRTCPMNDAGAKVLSEHSGKTLVCTLIDGQKKWWPEGEALPVAPKPTISQPPAPTGSNGGAAPEIPDIPFTPKYELSKKSLAKMKVIEDIAYGSAITEQKLDLYLPKGVKNPPLLIWTHGGGFVFGDENFAKYDDSAKLVEALIGNGIAIASVNYRLAQVAPYPAAGIDTKRAIRFLRANAAKYGYDSKRFATGGDSAGSYLALMAGITGNQPSVFDDLSDPNKKVSAAISTVIDLFGNVDFLEMASNKVKYPCDESKNPFPGAVGNIHPWFGDTTDPTVQATMKSAGLYPFLKKVKPIPAFYIFHGSDDCSVSTMDSKNLDKTVKALKGKSTLKIIPGAIHGGPEIWTALIKAIPAIKKSM
jgi:acetyl esterase/lipase